MLPVAASSLARPPLGAPVVPSLQSHAAALLVPLQRHADALAVPLQSGPSITGGGVLALLITFLLASAFYAVTLHLAATFFIGDVPTQRAAYVGPVPAAVSILLRQYGLPGSGVPPAVGLLVALVAALVADALAISRSYRISWRPTVVLTLLHFAFTTVLIVALNNIFGFVG